MIKTQIQFPDELHRELKRLAESKEWSLAETLRRAAEQFLARHPHPVPGRVDWSPPHSSEVGWRGLDHEQIRNAMFEDMEPRIGSDPPSH